MEDSGTLSRKFFQKPTLTVAKALLGSYLVRKEGCKIIKARIVEVEAYIGEDDLACHARAGKTKRTEVMYGEPGHAYVYLIYGMYYCFNIVTENEGYPAAILIRAVEVHGVPKKETNGPGKLCRFLKIDKTCNGHSLLESKKIWLEKGRKRKGEYIEKGKRINIDYAGKCRDYLWRFTLEEKIKPG